MTEDNPAWYQTWFDTPYYHILYHQQCLCLHVALSQGVAEMKRAFCICEQCVLLVASCPKHWHEIDSDVAISFLCACSS